VIRRSRQATGNKDPTKDQTIRAPADEQGKTQMLMRAKPDGLGSTPWKRE